MSRNRSPNYPSLPLEDAIERADKIFSAERQNEVDRATAARLIGYQGISGSADKALGTLSQYGILEKAGVGKVRISDNCLDILHPQSDQAKHTALLKAANHSPILSELLTRYPPDTNIVETALESFLVREGFQDAAIPAIIKTYTATAAYLEKNRANSTTHIHEQSEELDEERAAGSDTEGQTKEKGAPPETPENNSEWLRCRVSKSTEIRLIVNGPVDAKGIGRLIRLLETQKEILEEDQESDLEE